MLQKLYQKPTVAAENGLLLCFGSLCVSGKERRGMKHITNLLRPVLDLKATGDTIKKLMDAGGITVRDLQTFFGFEYPQAIYAWLNGRNLPTVDNLLVLAELFDVTINEIVQRKIVNISEDCILTA